MSDVVISNPVINSPFEEPQRHFRFTEAGITNGVVHGRRRSEYFVPIARPRKAGSRQLTFDEWTEDRIQENEFINRVRARVTMWREGGYVGVTGTARLLLQYCFLAVLDQLLGALSHIAQLNG